MALAIAAIYAVIYFYGGPKYASCACNAAGHDDAALLLHRLGRRWRSTCRCTGTASTSRTSATRSRRSRRPAPRRSRRGRGRMSVRAPAHRPAQRSAEQRRIGDTRGSCWRPRAGRSATRRSPRWWRLAAPGAARPRVLGGARSTGSRSGCRTPACCRPSASGPSSATPSPARSSASSARRIDRRRARRRNPQRDQEDPQGGEGSRLRGDRDGRRPRPQPRRSPTRCGIRSPSGYAAGPSCRSTWPSSELTARRRAARLDHRRRAVRAAAPA